MEAEPKPPRTSPVVELPGVTMSKLVPRAFMADLTDDAAPSPRPTVKMTAAMPIRMPSTVRAERSRWVVMASMPDHTVSSQLTPPPRPGPRTCRPGSALSAPPPRPRPARG